MIQRLWDRFLALFKRDTTKTEADDNSRFIPSPLDLSVRIGHGGRADEIDRELKQIQDRARDLEDSHRNQ